jgi:hypothetical protein
MERACKLIRGLRLPGGTLSDEELECAVWTHTAGRKFAAHTRAARLVRTRLRAWFADDLAAIADPVMRSIYLAAPKKAMA